MTPKILCILLGAITASAWWALAFIPYFQKNGFIVPAMVLTLGTIAVVVWETLKLHDK